MSRRKPRLPFPADDLQPPTTEQDHYGNLIVNAEIDPREASLRQFVTQVPSV